MAITPRNASIVLRMSSFFLIRHGFVELGFYEVWENLRGLFEMQDSPVQIFLCGCECAEPIVDKMVVGMLWLKARQDLFRLLILLVFNEVKGTINHIFNLLIDFDVKMAWIGRFQFLLLVVLGLSIIATSFTALIAMRRTTDRTNRGIIPDQTTPFSLCTLTKDALLFHRVLH
ncbi:MAG: hypothetical protein AB7S77_12755 [Desulfatirhabdiaceae bacterium]